MIPPLTRYKIASWLIRIWNSDGIERPHFAECDAILQRRIEHYTTINSRGAQTRKGMKYKPKVFAKCRRKFP